MLLFMPRTQIVNNIFCLRIIYKLYGGKNVTAPIYFLQFEEKTNIFMCDIRNKGLRETVLRSGKVIVFRDAQHLHYHSITCSPSSLIPDTKSLFMLEDRLPDTTPCQVFFFLVKEKGQKDLKKLTMLLVRRTMIRTDMAQLEEHRVVAAD